MILYASGSSACIRVLRHDSGYFIAKASFLNGETGRITDGRRRDPHPRSLEYTAIMKKNGLPRQRVRWLAMTGERFGLHREDIQTFCVRGTLIGRRFTRPNRFFLLEHTMAGVGPLFRLQNLFCPSRQERFLLFSAGDGFGKEMIGYFTFLNLSKTRKKHFHLQRKSV